MNEELNDEKNKKENKQFNILEMLKDKRKSALFKLGLYGLFFIIVFIYIGAVGNNNNNDNKQNNNNHQVIDNHDSNSNYGYITYPQYASLLNNNYEYNINYYINDKEYNITGKRKDSSYSSLGKTETNNILTVPSVLNVDLLLSAIKKSTLLYKTEYGSGVKIQEYEVSINNFINNYNISLNDIVDKKVNIKIYSNGSYVDKVLFDITNIGNGMDSKISKYQIEVYFSKLNSVK
jgi:hypothetical protein